MTFSKGIGKTIRPSALAEPPSEETLARNRDIALLEHSFARRMAEILSIGWS